MLITWKAIHNFIQGHYSLVSPKEFMAKYVSEDILQVSYLFAELVEDYRFLSALVENIEEHDQNFLVVWRPDMDRPFIIDAVDSDQSGITIRTFAMLAFTLRGQIPIQGFRDIVDQTATNFMAADEALLKVEEFDNIYNELLAIV